MPSISRPAHALLQSLSGGDRRSVGESNRVAALVLDQPRLIGILFQGLESSDPVLRMRCADAIEKVTAKVPELLVPYKRKIFKEFAKVDQQEVRWHVAPMLARLPLTAREASLAVTILLGYTNDRSSIVKTMAMQALTDIALRQRHLRAGITAHIQELAITGTPAMKARGRKLLKLLAASDHG